MTEINYKKMAYNWKTFKKFCSVLLRVLIFKQKWIWEDKQ